VIWEDEIEKDSGDQQLFEVLTKRLNDYAEARKRAGMYGRVYDETSSPWRKPWPDPLPDYLALDHTPLRDGKTVVDVSYFGDNDEDWTDIYNQLGEGDEFSFVPAVARWRGGSQTTWDGVEWKRALRTIAGLIDDASSARLRLLRVDFAIGHHVIFGASGWGKSVFLRTVITGLVATHAPDELHLYMLDFGNNRLRVFDNRDEERPGQKVLPHTGAFITAYERERVERLLRFLDEEVERRKDIFSRAGASNLPEYNEPQTRQPKMPAILVVIDNFAEFRASYENYEELIQSLARDGLANGIYFLITGEQTNALGKLFNLIPERMTLKQADEGEYANLVGRGAHPVDDIAGRGLRRIDRRPMEFQVAMPLGPDADGASGSDDDRLAAFIGRLHDAAAEGRTTIDPQTGQTISVPYTQPQRINVLEKWVALPKLIDEYTRALTPQTRPQRANALLLGRSDADLKPRTIDLQTLILGMAELYTPQQAAFVLIDASGGLATYGGDHRLDKLPHSLMDVVTESAHVATLIDQLENEFARTPNRPVRDVYIIFDSYDDVAEMFKKVPGEPAKARLGTMARKYASQGLHFIIAGTRDSVSGSGDDLARVVAGNSIGLAPDAQTAENSPLYANVPRSLRDAVLPRGRAFVVQATRPTLVQVAVPYSTAENRVDEMNAWVVSLQNQHPQRAEWPASVDPATNGSNSASKPAPQLPKALTPEQKTYLIQQLAVKRSQAEMLIEASFGFMDELLIDEAGKEGITLDGMDGGT
jgi:hypothetical protein